MRMEGFSALMGSWKIMLIRPPRILRISASEAVSRSMPSRTTLPCVTLPGVSFRRRMMDRLVTLLPQPDSPTRPRISPL